MTLWPVIVRELRAQSRQPATYWLRVAAAGIVLGMFVFLLLRLGRVGGAFTVVSPGRGQVNPFSGLGALLFSQMNAAIFLCNAFLAPLLTADCVARERREGTLGLLFLTDLSAAGIVAGKAFVHLLRAVMLFCAMLPVLAIPVLVGGVAARDCVMALLIDSIVLVLGLSAGIIASTFSRDWIRSVIVAELISATLVLAFMYFHVASLEYYAMWTRRSFGSFGSLIGQILSLFAFHTNMGSWRWGRQWGGPWDNIWSMGLSTSRDWIEIVAIIGVCALLMLLFSVLLAARRVERTWQEEPVSRRIAKAKAVLTRPRFATGALRRRLSRSLERNPIGWLQHYSWSGRITKWGWLAALILVESLAITDVRNFADMQPLFVLILVAGLAFTASASFREERESGALELLLVCPLTVAQLMWGRLRGIWTQYFPSFALLIVCLAFGAEIENYDSTHKTGWFYAITATVFITVPVIGLFFSLHTANSLAAWLWTMAVGIGLPLFAADQQRMILWFFGTPNAEAVVFCLQWVVAEIFWLLLYDRLSRRRFVIHA
jgi:ABC-type transport system involved in multi-copper enzyme maturation permease subunit